MCVQFKIKITKEIIQQCKNCGADNNVYEIGRNCALAFALKDIFPDVFVTNYYIFPFGIDAEKGKDIKIEMPLIAQQFIKLFDGFYLTPNLRLLLPEFEFSIDITSEILELINIDEITDLIKINKNRKAIVQIPA